jgi:creatinine amidohydrolase
MMIRWLALFTAVSAASAQTAAPKWSGNRLMDELNWMEFRQAVPSQVSTVLLTVGTLEPHGVINNGADNTAPAAMARAIAADVNALIAPHIPYGITGAMAPYPGAMQIPEPAFRAYFQAVVEGLAKNGFKNVIVLNGHGGPQTSVIESVLQQTALARNIRTLVVNWWSYASDITKEVFGEDGGHAGNNETAYIQAINPKLVHKEWYSRDMATPNPAPGTWAAVPFPSSIGLYQAGQGYPRDFNQAQADEYFRKVNAKVANLIRETIRKWEMAGLE